MTITSTKLLSCEYRFLTSQNPEEVADEREQNVGTRRGLDIETQMIFKGIPSIRLLILQSNERKLR